MKIVRASGATAGKAFTLIELLVVIAIIAVLAALIFPAANTFKRRATRIKVQTERDQVIIAIELFKEKFGYYPPDNPTSFVVNQLYFELSGTTLTNLSPGTPGFRTLDGSAQIATANVQGTFGTGGFVNCTKGGGEDPIVAKSFLKGLKPGQYGGVATGSPEIRLLTCTVNWPENMSPQPVPGAIPGTNPWRYNSSNPTNNPGSYDLWVDIFIAGKTYRISNWSKQPQTL